MTQPHYLTAMEEVAAKQLIEDHRSISLVIRDLAERFPEAPALSICFTLASVASGLEFSIGQSGADGFPSPAEIYRAASVVSAEIYGLEVRQNRTITAGLLVQHWTEIKDPHLGR